MGLFDSFKKKSDNGKVVWRNVNGQIVCPGDACPKDCDDTCPIYLNTQCVTLMQIGASDKALEIYKKALEIAPDFYDAYNNMAGIYGGQGRYQEAYACFYKAHELNKVRPNPVYGLALCCRDLNKPEECLKWCEVYNCLSNDGALDELYFETKEKLGLITENNPNKRNNDFELIENGIEWAIVKKEKSYYFVDADKEFAVAPRGSLLCTSYLELARRIVKDLDYYGPDDFSAGSILPWHYTMIESFSKMEHKQVEEILADSFINRHDWTYTVNNVDSDFNKIWGVRGVRENEIMDWLSKITIMQMTAACCIGNAYHSINISYILAVIMETFPLQEREPMFKKLVALINDNSDFYASIEDIKNFELYYGLHLNEDGKVLVKEQ